MWGCLQTWLDSFVKDHIQLWWTDFYYHYYFFYKFFNNRLKFKKPCSKYHDWSNLVIDQGFPASNIPKLRRAERKESVGKVLAGVISQILIYVYIYLYKNMSKIKILIWCCWCYRPAESSYFKVQPKTVLPVCTKLLRIQKQPSKKGTLVVDHFTYLRTWHLCQQTTNIKRSKE